MALLEGCVGCVGSSMVIIVAGYRVISFGECVEKNRTRGNIALGGGDAGDGGI